MYDRSLMKASKRPGTNSDGFGIMHIQAQSAEHSARAFLLCHCKVNVGS